MNMQMPLTFNEGVYLLPVTELPDGSLGTLRVSDDDFALTRPQGRTGSKIIDRDSADLVKRFQEPRTIVDAVVLFSRARGVDPQLVLDSAFPMLRGLVASGYLVEVIDGVPVGAAGGPLNARWQDGDELAGGRVLRCLQVLEDTELYLLANFDGSFNVAKVERRLDDATAGPTSAQLMRERAVLARLGGELAPRLTGSGNVDGRAYITMEFVPGVDAQAEATGFRRCGGTNGHSSLLRLMRAIARAYAALHGAGILHGDVHPRNLLVDGIGSVRLIDFGLAVELDDTRTTDIGIRGGIPFFLEPELARALIAGRASPGATPAGEQYAVAAMMYFLVTGAHTRDFPLVREEMLREIAELPALPFVARGRSAWPALEDVLRHALAKDPADRYPSLAAFAEALDQRELERGLEDLPEPHSKALPDVAERCCTAMAIGGDWQATPTLPAPNASINYGAAGVALGLLHLAQARDNAGHLTLAQHWIRRALRAAEADDAFYNAEIDITRETVGGASPYHSLAGVRAVEALLARSLGNVEAQRAATEAFLSSSVTGHKGLDLTLGKSATLLGAALLLDALPSSSGPQVEALSMAGNRLLAEIWEDLDREPAITEASIEYPGMAHGWAGFAYAALLWSATADVEAPRSIFARLAELATLARPAGRGLVWPWSLRGQGRGMTMPGWCNGSCGYVFLWTLASRVLNEPSHLDLAVGAAWDAWDAPDEATSLCCGTAGRAYALLNLYRATGDSLWLQRARQLASRGAAFGTPQVEKAHCLWKGDLGLAVLHADLERPEDARMPFFESAGWASRPPGRKPWPGSDEPGTR